jgi:hypothetical protein
MKIKEGAQIRGLSPEMVIACIITDQIMQKHGGELVITEGTGGKHKIGSLHYVGLAIDARIRMFNSSELAIINLELIGALGSEFDVVLEKDHFHIEFQPKTI